MTANLSLAFWLEVPQVNWLRKSSFVVIAWS
jgi:hypothetical protein